MLKTLIVTVCGGLLGGALAMAFFDAYDKALFQLAFEGLPSLDIVQLFREVFFLKMLIGAFFGSALVVSLYRFGLALLGVKS